MPCPLCGSKANSIPPEGYLHCQVCDMRFLEPARRLSRDEERERYELHENETHDEGYRNFLAPLRDAILERVPKGSHGLDFGCGPDSYLARMLEDEELRIDRYDPFFAPNTSLLERKYDFVYASEVLEHLYDPVREIERLRDLIRPGGYLFAMTAFTSETLDFPNWYYRRDPTHVVFYSPRTFAWIRDRFGFRQLDLETGRVAILRR